MDGFKSKYQSSPKLKNAIIPTIKPFLPKKLYQPTSIQQYVNAINWKSEIETKHKNDWFTICKLKKHRNLKTPYTA